MTERRYSDSRDTENYSYRPMRKTRATVMAIINSFGIVLHLAGDNRII